MKQGFLRWLAKNQAVLFFPLRTLEGLNPHVLGIRAVWRGETKMRRVEGTLLTAPSRAAARGVSRALARSRSSWCTKPSGAFTWAVRSRPTTRECRRRPAGLLRQMLSSRDIRGGLNYQIEHHLFSGIPRPHLRRTHPIVERFCRQHEIPYAQNWSAALLPAGPRPPESARRSAACRRPSYRFGAEVLGRLRQPRRNGLRPGQSLPAERARKTVLEADPFWCPQRARQSLANRVCVILVNSKHTGRMVRNRVVAQPVHEPR
ncbi:MULTISPECIES: fatty acid desaturase [Amycolatopsis]|uniref:fatty acid desaturase n=1 Tax=Amycolatopsis TaxID=1813 RepID=UPI001E4F77B6|nr:fatty acid desaturase [Amycolatopsis sp. M39]